MPGEVAVRSQPAIAPALAELGISIIDDAGAGYRGVMIPPSVRGKVNVLLPVQSFAQALPEFTPSVRLVELDVEQHSYNNAAWGREKRALNKQGLEILADTAGVVYMKTGRVPKAELHEGEKFAYWAEIGIRQHDGTIKPIRREKGYEEDAEYAEIVDAVDRAVVYRNGQPTNQKKFPPGAARDAEIRKRWLQEQKYAAAKTESKAVLRAIRAALQIPHQFHVNDLKKPFLVVGYSFTPDYSDPEIRRILVLHGLAAAGELYGVQGRDADTIEASAAPVLGPAADGGEEAGGELGNDGQPAPGPDAGTVRSPSAETPEWDDSDAEPEPEPGSSSPEVEVAGAVEMGAGKFAGQTIAQIFDAGNRWYVEWLAGEKSEGKVADDVRAAARTFLEAQE